MSDLKYIQHRLGIMARAARTIELEIRDSGDVMPETKTRVEILEADLARLAADLGNVRIALRARVDG